MNRTFFHFVSSSAVGLGLLAGGARAAVSVAVGTLAPGESVQVSYEVTIDAGIAPSLAHISQQVTVTHSGGSVLSDDPETAPLGDATLTPLADVIAPRVVSIVRVAPAASPATADEAVFRLTFDEAVQNVDGADFALTGTTATVTTVTAAGGQAYDLVVGGGNFTGVEGLVTLGFAAGQNIRDLGGNAFVDLVPTGANQNSVELQNNDAPVLTSGNPVLPGILSTDLNNPGYTVASFVGSSITDADPGALQGIAILTAGGDFGRWQFRLSGGSAWTDFGTFTGTTALLLRSTDRIRYVPDGLRGDHPAMLYTAWDQTGATAGREGTFFESTVSGGRTPFSLGGDFATLTVTPEVIGTYDDWLEANFTANERDNPAIVGLESDPDGAGVTNLVRFAFDLPARGPVGPTTRWTLIEQGGVQYQALEFNVRAAGPGLSYVVERSTNLVNWLPVSTWYPGSTNPIIARDAVAYRSVPRSFLRLRIVFNP